MKRFQVGLIALVVIVVMLVCNYFYSEKEIEQAQVEEVLPAVDSTEVIAPVDTVIVEKAEL